MYYLLAVQASIFVAAGFCYFLYHLFEYGTMGVFGLVLFGLALCKMFNFECAGDTKTHFPSLGSPHASADPLKYKMYDDLSGEMSFDISESN